MPSRDNQWVVLEGGDLHPKCVKIVYGPFDSFELAEAFATAQGKCSTNDVELAQLNVSRKIQ